MCSQILIAQTQIHTLENDLPWTECQPGFCSPWISEQAVNEHILSSHLNIWLSTAVKVNQLYTHTHTHTHTPTRIKWFLDHLPFQLKKKKQPNMPPPPSSPLRTQLQPWPQCGTRSPGTVWLGLSPAGTELVRVGGRGQSPPKTWATRAQGCRTTLRTPPVPKTTWLQRLLERCAWEPLTPLTERPYSSGFAQPWRNKSKAERVTEDTGSPQPLGREEALPYESKF